jgi:uncharacterized protein DUF6152
VRSIKMSGLLAGFIGLVLVSTAALAHHGYAAYDMTTTLSVKATIVSLLMENPHSSIAFDVKDGNGNVEHWFSESGNPRNMRADGFTPDSVKPGDQVTIYYHPSKNGAHVVVLTRVEFPDGRVLPQHDRGQNNPDQ